jgi:hypothetical protein
MLGNEEQQEPNYDGRKSYTRKGEVNENLGANSKYEFSKPKGIKETIFA